MTSTKRGKSLFNYYENPFQWVEWGHRWRGQKVNFVCLLFGTKQVVYSGTVKQGWKQLPAAAENTADESGETEQVMLCVFSYT